MTKVFVEQPQALPGSGNNVMMKKEDENIMKKKVDEKILMKRK